MKDMRLSTFIISLALLSAATFAKADDSVVIKYDSGYPIPGRSSEHIQLSLNRVSPMSGSQADIDKYFSKVQKILTEANVPPSWGSPIIDAPYVEIEISIENKKFVLISSYGSAGVALPYEATEADKKIAVAFKTLIQLSTEQTNAHLFGK